MDSHLKDDNVVANIFGKDEQVPPNIPFYLKAITVKSANHAGSAIAIYVGKLHYGCMMTLITKAPFDDFELVPLSVRRTDKDSYDQRVQLHHFLCQDSGAIKLRNTSPDFQTSSLLNYGMHTQLKTTLLILWKQLQPKKKALSTFNA